MRHWAALIALVMVLRGAAWADPDAAKPADERWLKAARVMVHGCADADKSITHNSADDVVMGGGLVQRKLRVTCPGKDPQLVVCMGGTSGGGGAPQCLLR